MQSNGIWVQTCICLAATFCATTAQGAPTTKPPIAPPSETQNGSTPALVHTKPVEPVAQGARIGDLARIQEEKLLVKARLDLLSMQGQLKTAGVKNGQVEQSFAPTVKAVLGSRGVLYATFAYPGNMTVDAKVGDVITGGYTVDSIGVDQVVLSHNGEKLRLGFSASPPTPLPAHSAASSGPIFNPGMPAGMPH